MESFFRMNNIIWKNIISLLISIKKYIFIIPISDNFNKSNCRYNNQININLKGLAFTAYFK